MRTDMRNELRKLESVEFGTIRTVIDEYGKMWFGGSDVATALGYAIPTKAINTHCKVVSKMEVTHPQALDKLIKMVFISEGDVYRLIARSKLPQAQKFECWIFDEVLPTIRKHGMYAEDEILDNPELLIKVAQRLQAEKNKNAELIVLNEVLENELVEMEALIDDVEPHMEYLNSIIHSDLTLTATQIAADYGMSAIKLNRILEEEKVQRKVNGQWVICAKYVKEHLTESATVEIPNPYSNQKRYVIQTKWSQKGRMLIHRILDFRGIFPVRYSGGERYSI